MFYRRLKAITYQVYDMEIKTKLNSQLTERENAKKHRVKTDWHV